MEYKVALVEGKIMIVEALFEAPSQEEAKEAFLGNPVIKRVLELVNKEQVKIEVYNAP